MALSKFNYNSFDLTTAASKGLAFNSSANGFETSSATSMTLIKTLTASSSSTLSFVDGSSSVVLDSTYPIYKFEFINIHPATDGAEFRINFSTDSGSNYNVSKTSTFFQAQHSEADATQFTYETDFDLANGTGGQVIVRNVGSDNDQATSGNFWLFSPSSTTFVKHFFGRSDTILSSNKQEDGYVAGYCNTTSAVDGVQFIMSSGNIDAGTIKLYGLKDS